MPTEKKCVWLAIGLLRTARCLWYDLSISLKVNSKYQTVDKVVKSLFFLLTYMWKFHWIEWKYRKCWWHACIHIWRGRNILHRFSNYYIVWAELRIMRELAYRNKHFPSSYPQHITSNSKLNRHFDECEEEKNPYSKCHKSFRNIYAFSSYSTTRMKNSFEHKNIYKPFMYTHTHTLFILYVIWP